MNSEETPLPDGIQHIALSFSGGGFRAATFSLGCCSYLDSLPYDKGKMLDKVRYISSVSGGSITAIALFSMKRQGKSFDEIYRHTLAQISGTNLLDRVFEVMNNESYWSDRPDKSRNLINAFAIVYDRDLFRGANYGSLFIKPGDETLPVIDELCVNSTELNNGMNFRFSTRGRIGNQYLSLYRAKEASFDLIKQIKLGDLLASSSCFPVGFEPVVFPRDFTFREKNSSLSWQKLGEVVRTKDYYSGNFEPLVVAPEMFGLMDGGIDDNQGIYAFRMADDRKTTKYKFDLYLTCDVSSNYLEKPFKVPKEDNSSWLKPNLPTWLARIKCYLTGACVIFLTLSIVSSVMLVLGFPMIWPIVLGFSVACLIGCLFIRNYFLKVQKLIRSFTRPTSAKRDKPGTWGNILSKYGTELLKMPLNKILLMISARGASLFLLTDTVFLKKIRRASYDQLFTDPNRPKNQIGVTAVYLLSTKNNRMLQQEIKKDLKAEDRVVSSTDPRLIIDVLQPGDALRVHVDRAAAMETTLWFDDYHLKDGASESLLIAGQATMCYNLLRMAFRIESKHSSWPELQSKLLSDWEKFKAQPDWLTAISKRVD